MNESYNRFQKKKIFSIRQFLEISEIFQGFFSLNIYGDCFRLRTL